MEKQREKCCRCDLEIRKGEEDPIPIFGKYYWFCYSCYDTIGNDILEQIDCDRYEITLKGE